MLCGIPQFYPSVRISGLGEIMLVNGDLLQMNLADSALMYSTGNRIISLSQKGHSHLVPSRHKNKSFPWFRTPKHMQALTFSEFKNPSYRRLPLQGAESSTREDFFF